MITDVNVHISRWPFRRLHGDEITEFVAKLRDKQVTQAWAGLRRATEYPEARARACLDWHHLLFWD